MRKWSLLQHPHPAAGTATEESAEKNSFPIALTMASGAGTVAGNGAELN